MYFKNLAEMLNKLVYSPIRYIRWIKLAVFEKTLALNFSLNNIDNVCKLVSIRKYE